MIPKYVVNFDELTNDLKKKILELIGENLKDKYLQLNFNNIKQILQDLNRALPSKQYKELKEKIEELIHAKYEDIQKIESKLLDIPPIIQENKVDFKFDKDIYLTGLHFNQTGWKKEDTWDLFINKNKIIDHATIKEIGEHKYFNTYFKVSANTPIFFILNNKSGNSRQVMVDLEYIEII